MEQATSVVETTETTTDSEALRQEIERLKAENHRLANKTTQSGELSFRVSQKGAMSVYGMGRFPVTLYKEQWFRLLDREADIRTFLVDNDDKLKSKGE